MTNTFHRLAPAAVDPRKQLRAVGTGEDSARSALVQPEGKIVAAGYTENGGNHDFSLTRLDADGALDAGFGNGGRMEMTVRPPKSGESVPKLMSNRFTSLPEAIPSQERPPKKAYCPPRLTLYGAVRNLTQSGMKDLPEPTIQSQAPFK